MKNHLSIAAAAAVLFISAGCTTELPGTETPEGKLYVEKCSTCHPAPHPQILRIKAWKLQVEKMEKKVMQMKVREPLTEEEKATILKYLDKHARKVGY